MLGTAQVIDFNDTLSQEITSLMSLSNTPSFNNETLAGIQVKSSFTPDAVLHLETTGEVQREKHCDENIQQEEEPSRVEICHDEDEESGNLATIVAPLKVTKSVTRYQNNQVKRNICPNCRNSDVQLVGGNYVCYSCYSLLESVFDEGGEWKSYQNDSTTVSNPRCSLQVNPYLPETSAHTFIKTDATDKYTQKFQQLNNWMVPHHEKSLNTRLHDLNYYGNLCNLPGNAIDFAKQVYVEFIELQPLHKKKKSSRGDCHSAIIAVILLIGCKEFNIRRSPDDICQQVGLTSTDFTKAGNLVFSVLQHSHLIDISHHQYIVRSSDYINSFCHTIGLTNDSLINSIYEVENRVHELKILQKNTPQAIACGCIYFVTKMMGIKIDRRDFESKCSVSLPTLNKVYDNLIEHTDQLIL